jgi:hypothetical protein
LRSSSRNIASVASRSLPADLVTMSCTAGL